MKIKKATPRKPAPKKTSPKISGLVVAALRNLRDAHGSSPKEIMKCIMAEYNASEATVQRQLKMALKRGVEYGILKKTTGGYSLNTEAEPLGKPELEPMDSCGRKRRSCKPKRRACRPKRKSCRPKKRKRASCPRRRRKRNPCNVCATRGRGGDCSKPVQIQPASLDDEEVNVSGTEADKRSVDDRSGQEMRSRSTSRRPPSRQIRSRSQSEQGFSGSEDDDKDED